MAYRDSAGGAGLAYYIVLPGAGSVRPWPKDRDRFVLLALLRRVMKEHGAACEGWCLLEREAHLLLAAATADAARAAAAEAARRYARYWHGWYAPRRRVLRPARVAAVPAGLQWDALAHLETGPVRAGLCRDACLYRWSSAAEHAGWATSYLPLEMERWSASWTCPGWRERLEEWGTDLRRLKAVLRLLEDARPVRTLAAPAAAPAAPLFAGQAAVAQAAAGWA
jgi:hypothetical protein